MTTSEARVGIAGRRRWLRLAAAGAAASIGGARGATTRRLAFWTMQLAPFHNTFVQGLIEGFQRLHPRVDVHWVDVPWAEMERKALASIAAGAAPDVINLNPQFSARLAEFGALADPQQHLPAAVLAGYLPTAFDAGRLRGKAFALPWYVTTNILLVQRSVLQRARVAVPRLWDDLLATARAIRRQSGVHAYFPPLDGSAALETMVSFGVPLLSADACAPGFVNPRGAQALRLHRQLFAEGLIPRNVLTEGHRNAVAQFLSGQVAMVSTGMQFLGTLRKNHARLADDVDVAPPLGDPAQAPNIAVMNLAVPERARDKALAFAFAAFVTDAANQVALARRVPILSSHRGSYEDAFFREPSGDALLDRARELSVAQVRRGAVQVPPLPGYHKLRVSYVRGLQSVMLGRSEPEAALREIDRTWRGVLGCAA